jgi:hypothetical protein
MSVTKQLREERRNGKKRQNMGNPSDSWKGFIDLPMPDALKERVKDDVASGQLDALRLVLDLLEDGYKLSITGDWAHHSIICAATGREDHCPNKGYTLSARGPEVLAALAMLHAKIYQLADAGRWEDVQQSLPGFDPWG